APLDLLFEARFPVVRAGMVAHLPQDDDLAPHVVDLGVGEEDAHLCLLLLRHSRHVALRPSTEVQSALKDLAGRRCLQTAQQLPSSWERTDVDQRAQSRGVTSPSVASIIAIWMCGMGTRRPLAHCDTAGCDGRESRWGASRARNSDIVSRCLSRYSLRGVAGLLMRPHLTERPGHSQAGGVRSAMYGPSPPSPISSPREADERQVRSDLPPTWGANGWAAPCDAEENLVILLG